MLIKKRCIPGFDNLEFNKRGGPNKVRGGRKKIGNLISGGDVYLALKSILLLKYSKSVQQVGRSL